jgi:hypothetical protein
MFFAGTLTVNVSVLLLSLASPDESSLVSFFFPLICCEMSWRHSSPLCSPLEIRSGILAATTMVRPETEICKSIAIRLSECNTSSRGYLAARHLLHHARRLQGSPHTDAFCLKNLSQRHNQLSDEVRNKSSGCGRAPDALLSPLILSLPADGT